MIFHLMSWLQVLKSGTIKFIDYPRMRSFNLLSDDLIAFHITVYIQIYILSLSTTLTAHLKNIELPYKNYAVRQFYILNGF